jgi:hypothetical protein
MKEEELQQKQGKRAEALSNPNFICIETYSGRGRLGSDPRGVRHLLDPDASDEAIGLAILDALKLSRFLSTQEYDGFFDPEPNRQRYADWVVTLMKRYGYKTKRALFKNMKNCGIHQNTETFIFSPTRHEKLEGWSGEGISDEDLVVIPATSSPIEVGQALRKAFARCT